MLLQVCQNEKGYYIGFTCNNCGPYDRVSTYAQSKKLAEAYLEIIPMPTQSCRED